MEDKVKKQIKSTIDRLKNGYPLDKYQGYKHLAEHTKECDMLFLVEIIEKYDLLHCVMRSEYPPEHVRIACAEYYKRGHPVKALRLTNRFSKMNFKQSKIYCDEHYK